MSYNFQESLTSGRMSDFLLEVPRSPKEMHLDIRNAFKESRSYYEDEIETFANAMRMSGRVIWESSAHRRIWTAVAVDVLREHMLGKKTVISEASFRAYFNSDNRLLAETVNRLDEGALDFITGAAEKIGGFFAKTFGKAFGGVKSRNWWLFGGGGEKEDKKYREAYVDGLTKASRILGNMSRQTVIALVDEIKKANPEFPNGGSGTDFMTAMSKFWETYCLIAHAAGAPVEGVDMPAGNVQSITGNDANKAIKGLRQVLQGFDRDLKDRYTYNMESRTRRLPTLTEALLLEDDDDIGAQGRKTSGTKGLESNVAPAIIAALGAAGVGFGWLVKQPWFLSMLRGPGAGTAVEILTQGKVVGVTQQLAILLGNPTANLSEMPLSQFLGLMKQKGLVDAAGNPTTHLLNMAKNAGNTKFATWWKTELAGKPPGDTLAELIPLSGSGAPGAGGDVLTAKILALTKAAGATTAGSTVATLTAVGPLAKTIGAGALIAAAAVKSLRMFGKKNSRTALIQSILDKMVDVKGGDEIPNPEPPPPPPQPAEGISVELTNSETRIVPADGFVSPNGAQVSPIATSVAPLNDKEEIIAAARKLLFNAFETGSISPRNDKTKDQVLALFDNPDNVEIDDKRTDKREGDGGGGRNEEDGRRGNRTAPGQGGLVRVDLTTGEDSTGVGSPNNTLNFESRIHSLKHYMLEAGEARRIGTSADKEMKKKWKSIGDEARKTPTGVPVDSQNFPIPENEFLKRHNIDKGKGTNLNLATYDDRVIKRGLSGIRSTARSGNVILGFENDAINALEKVGVPDYMHKALLTIYARDPNSPPQSVDDYINALKQLNAKQDVLNKIDKNEFQKVLDDIGMLANPPKASAKRKSSSKTESYVDDRGEIIVERWQRLAGIIK